MVSRVLPWIAHDDTCPHTIPAGQLLGVFKALADPVRLQVLQWLREPDEHCPPEHAIADHHEVGVCVNHIRAPRA